MENLKALVYKGNLNLSQRALAKREFEGLIERLELFEKAIKNNAVLPIVNDSPCFGVVEMAVHDFFTSHNGIQEITNLEGESYTMEFLEDHKEWLGISDDC